jgi:hypothetical protein
MVDELKQSQLARIVVPAITDAAYSTSLADAFDKINDNFKKIASLPFLQGVQGDSYQLEEYPIWEKDTTENWILTEDGKILLDSIFGIDTTRDGNSFNDIRACIGQLMPEENGVSPIDFFKSGNDIINNSIIKDFDSKTTTVYELDSLGKMDSYDVFLSGATPLVEITSNSNSNKELIIFRDSFGSSISPLLIDYYRKITLIDNRYIHSSKYLEKVEFNNQDVLFLYSTLIINSGDILKVNTKY